MDNPSRRLFPRYDCHQILFSVADEGLRNSIIRILMGNVL